MTESTQPRTSSVSKRLTILYMAALGSIALLTIVGQLVVQKAILQLEGDSRIVNIAGRQRMLSQRLTRMTFEMALSKHLSQNDTSSFNKLIVETRKDLETWTKNHQGLRYGSAAAQLPGQISPSVERLFNELAPHFEELRESIESSIVRFSTEENGALDHANRIKISFHSDAFLAGMDSIVSILELEARDRVSRLRWIETALLIATIAVLVCEGLFVFSPAVASLDRSLTKLQTTSNELEKAKDLAENANLAKTDFLARVSHELRTPLHGILGMLGLVSRTQLRPDQRSKIRLANEASTSLLSLVDDLLDVARIEQGKEFVDHPRVVHLAGLLKSTSELLSPLAIAKGLLFELKLGDSLPKRVIVDADRVRQVLSNLLQNAIRYTTIGAVHCKVDIQTEATRVFLRIAIEDTGIGIAPNDQERIFTSFSPDNNSDTSSEFGRRMGLGLTTTKAIVKELGGTISLSSEVGKGSRFSVTIPVLVSKANETDKVDNAKSPLRYTGGLFNSENAAKPTALIVDDSPTNLLVMRSYLKRLGYRTMSVSSFKESIARFRIHRFDIVLMDRNLKDGDGLNFPQLVADLDDTPHFRSSRFFLVTAEINLTANSDLRLKPFTGVLHKPISLSELQSAIEMAYSQKTATDRTDEGDFSFERLKSKLAGKVIETLPDDIESLESMLSQCDYAGLQFISHRMIGSAGNAGLLEVAALASNLNDAAVQRDRPKIELTLSKLATFALRAPFFYHFVL